MVTDSGVAAPPGLRGGSDVPWCSLALVRRGMLCGLVASVLSLGPIPRPPWAQWSAPAVEVADPVRLGPAAAAFVTSAGPELGGDER